MSSSVPSHDLYMFTGTMLMFPISIACMSTGQLMPSQCENASVHENNMLMSDWLIISGSLGIFETALLVLSGLGGNSSFSEHNCSELKKPLKILQDIGLVVVLLWIVIGTERLHRYYSTSLTRHDCSSSTLISMCVADVIVKGFASCVLFLYSICLPENPDRLESVDFDET